MADELKTIGVLHAALTLGSGMVAALTIYGDQPGGGFKTNPTRQRGRTLMAPTMPDLLRITADFMEQEDCATLEELGDRLANVGRGGPDEVGS